MFILSPEPIDPNILKRELENPESGACVIFEGWVRNHNDGKAVLSLEYEGYAELCQREAEIILSEARKRFAIENAICSHRTGHLEIGGMAVWLGVTARHRGSAFEACRYIIDQVKARLPIWKKEFYQDGKIEWVNCQECARQGHTHGETMVDFEEKKLFNHYYKRQMVLPGWGVNAQSELQSKRILVVGAGGLGCGALPYLAGAGIGHLAICDGDTVDASNLHRQILYSIEDIGRSKAELAAEKLRKQNPMIHIKVWDETFSILTAETLLEGCDLVLDCTDNFMTKYLLNDTCWMKGIPLIYAGVYRWEGQLMVFHPGYPEAGCLRCLWPEIPDQLSMGTCTQVGILGAVAGCLGSMQAIEAIKLLLGHPFSTDFAIHGFKSSYTQKIQRNRQISCPLCGDNPSITSIQAAHYQSSSPRFEWELDRADPQEYRLTDIREVFEIEEDIPDGILQLPYTQIQLEPDQLNPQKKYLFICPRGIKSRMLVLSLRERGLKNVFSLWGGTERHPY